MIGRCRFGTEGWAAGAGSDEPRKRLSVRKLGARFWKIASQSGVSSGFRSAFRYTFLSPSRVWRSVAVRSFLTASQRTTNLGPRSLQNSSLKGILVLVHWLATL